MKDIDQGPARAGDAIAKAGKIDRLLWAVTIAAALTIPASLASAQALPTPVSTVCAGTKEECQRKEIIELRQALAEAQIQLVRRELQTAWAQLERDVRLRLKAAAEDEIDLSTLTIKPKSPAPAPTPPKK